MEPLRGEEVLIPMSWGNMAGKLWGSAGGGEPVLCLHGHMDNAASWDRLLTQLLQLAAAAPALRCCCLALDLAGHGRSDRYPPSSLLSPLEYLADLKRVMEYYQWPHVSILAHSLGGRLALHFAGCFPHLVKCLVLLDFTPGGILYEAEHVVDLVRHEVNSLIRNTTQESSPQLDEEIKNEIEAFEKFTDIRASSAETSKFFLPLFQRSIIKISGKSFSTKDKRNISLLLPLMTSQFHLSLISQVQCSTLIIMSERFLSTAGQLRPFTATIDTLKEKLKNKLSMVTTTGEESSHDMHIEYPDSIAPIILGYMVLKNKL